MQKLIKLSETHYIICDDSEIKVNDWVYSMDGVHQWFGLILKTEPLPKKITYSTQPELLGTGWMQSVLPLLLSEVEEAIYGYNVEKMGEEATNIRILKHKTPIQVARQYFDGYVDGFNTHKELVKDKLFTVEKAIQILEEEKFGQGSVGRDEYKARVISKLQSLLPKTEWNIEITPEGKIVLL